MESSDSEKLVSLGNREKQVALDRLLADEYVLVHLSTAAPGVVIPDYLRANPVVTLKLSRWFKGSMELSSERICAELLFNGEYFTCLVPLTAVWGATSVKGDNLVWPSSMPAEIMKQTALLTVHDGSAEAQPELAPVETQPSGENKPNKVPHLRRVK